jgi:processive 1,2-diacylglycerol beta-glucosyltransferase
VPARAIAAGIVARRPDAQVEIVDSLDVLGRSVRRVADEGFRQTFGRGRMNWVFGGQYRLFARTPPLRALGQELLGRIAGARMQQEIELHAPDVVVSTYPIATEVIGRLRREKRIAIPVVSAVTDLSGLWYWASRGIDLHLLTHPESAAEVERIAGPGRIVAVRGLHDERFLQPPEPEEARARLGLDPPVVVVSGGGWGVGDVIGAARIATEQANVVVLAGHNELLLDASPPAGVRILPFVDDMPTLLSAADVLVHSTAGLTILEALLVGCRPISYGWHTGHVRVNERAFERTGLARVARTESELRRAVAAALAEPRVPQAPRHASLPHAADLILELAGS